MQTRGDGVLRWSRPLREGVDVAMKLGERADGFRLAPDPSRQVGPVTRAALIEKQSAKLGWADGIYSPAMDSILGFGVYAQA